MKNKFKYLMFTFASAVALTGCFPDSAEEALKYNGSSVVEFKNHTLGVVKSVLTAKGIATTAGAQNDTVRTVLLNSRVTDTVLVQLVGPHSNTAIELEYEVDPSSTAVEGVNYNFIPGNSRTVTIPANSSQGHILIDMIENSITDGKADTLTLRLQGNDKYKASKNYDNFHVILKP